MDLKPVNYPWEEFIDGSEAQIIVKNVNLVGTIPNPDGSGYRMVDPSIPDANVVFALAVVWQKRPSGAESYVITDGGEHYIGFDWARGLNMGDWVLIEEAISTFAKKMLGNGL